LRIPVISGSRASCGDAAVGNPVVTVEGIPVCIVGESIAGGIIAGPGATRVFISGRPMSVQFDSVAPHGDSPHNSALMSTLATGRVVVQ